MKKGLTLTERAIIQLNNISLTIHDDIFQRRLNQLIDRMAGDRLTKTCFSLKEGEL